ncbi:nucleoside triphosphate pyrophosphohydrolase [Halonatronum saccharophilum]|uniref:nucleoside triphosphate pyrophosphohydrolase n=1 Tax=Halonatronum saccharophilum TaxID=150060 RepID=UPI0004863B4C|nr:nucleoside triphosphate pyrophosphohydrolase [Halonatronum saccharophilum]
MKEYDKLIRDKIPKIIEEAGKNYNAEVMGEREYKSYLKKKLLEEVDEYIESEEVEELADILEVIYAIIDLKGIDLEEVERIRKKKAQDRGAFKKRLKLLKVYS